MKATTENDVLKSCLCLLAARGVMAWRNQSTGIYDPTRKIFRKLPYGAIRGASDIIGLLPVSQGHTSRPEDEVGTSGRTRHGYAPGTFLAIEVKRPGKVPSVWQESFLQSIRDNGGVAIYVDDVQQLDTFLASLGL